MRGDVVSVNVPRVPYYTAYHRPGWAQCSECKGRGSLMSVRDCESCVMTGLSEIPWCEVMGESAKAVWRMTGKNQ